MIVRYHLSIDLDGDHFSAPPSTFDIERVVYHALLDKLVRQRLPWETDDDREAVVMVAVTEGP